MSQQYAIDLVNSENIKILDNSFGSYYSTYEKLFNAIEIEMSDLYAFFETYYNNFKTRGNGIFFKTVNNYDEEVISSKNKDESAVALFDFFIFKRLYGNLTIYDNTENSLSNILSFANKRNIDKKFYRNILDNINLKLDIAVDRYQEAEIDDVLASITNTLVSPAEVIGKSLAELLLHKDTVLNNVFFNFFNNMVESLDGEDENYYLLLNYTKHFSDKEEIKELKENIRLSMLYDIKTILKKEIIYEVKTSITSNISHYYFNATKDDYFLQNIIMKVLENSNFCKDVMDIYYKKYGDSKTWNTYYGIKFLILYIGMEVFFYDIDSETNYLFLLNKTYYEYLQTKISSYANDRTLRKTINELENKMYDEMTIEFEIEGKLSQLNKGVDNFIKGTIGCERFHLITFFLMYISLYRYIKETYINIEAIEDEDYKKRVKGDTTLIKEYLPDKLKKVTVPETYFEEILVKYSVEKINGLISMFTYIVMKEWSLKSLGLDNNNDKIPTLFFLKVFSVGFNYATYSPVNLFEELNFDSEFKKMEIMAKDMRLYVSANFKEFIKETLNMCLYKSWNGIAPIGIIEIIQTIKVIPDELKDGIYLEFTRLDFDFNAKTKIYEAMTKSFFIDMLNWVKNILLTTEIAGTSLEEVYISLYTLREIFSRLKDSNNIKELLKKGVNTVKTNPLFVDYRNKGYGLFSLNTSLSVRYNRGDSDLPTYYNMLFSNEYKTGLIEYVSDKLSGLISYDKVLERNFELLGLSVEVKNDKIPRGTELETEANLERYLTTFKTRVTKSNYFTLENISKKTFILVNYLQRKHFYDKGKGSIIYDVKALKNMLSEITTLEAKILIYYTNMNGNLLYSGYTYPEIKAIKTFTNKDNDLIEINKIENYFKEGSSANKYLTSFYDEWIESLNIYEQAIDEVEHYLYNYVKDTVGDNKVYDYFVKFYSTAHLIFGKDLAEWFYDKSNNIVNHLNDFFQWFANHIAEFELGLTTLYEMYIEKFRIFQSYQGVKDFSEVLQKTINSLNTLYTKFDEHFELCSI